MTFLPHKHLALDATARSSPGGAVTFQHEPNCQVAGSIDAHPALNENGGAPSYALDLEVGQIRGTKPCRRRCRPRLVGGLHALDSWNCFFCGNLGGNRRRLARARRTMGSGVPNPNKCQHFVQGRNGGWN